MNVETYGKIRLVNADCMEVMRGLPDKGCDNKPLRTCKATNDSSDRKAHQTLWVVADELCKAG